MRNSLHLLGLVVVLSLGTASACREDGTPEVAKPVLAVEKETMGYARVSVDLFSGRENPSWTLSPEDELAVRRILKELHETNRRLPEPGLGYRGFMVMWADGARTRVYKDMVELTEGARTVLYEDSGRTLEQELLAGAKSHLTPELYKLLESQVQSP